MAENAGIWLRVSSGAQDEALQVPDTTRWADDHGYQVRKTYTLHGQSASKGKHQKMLDQVIADMQAGVITVLVVWASSRIERRGAYNAFQLAEQVRKAGGRIEYVKDEYLNTTNDMSDVMLALAATKDKMYAKTLSDASQRTVATVRGNGAFYGRTPWGFTTAGPKLGKRLVPTDVARKYVPEIFRRVVAGDSLATIARWLESEGVSPTGIKRDGSRGKSGQWWPRSLGELIRNPVYLGTHCDADGKPVHIWTTDDCKELVDAFTWQQANKSLDSRPKRGPMNTGNAALLKGALRCESCGGPMYRINSGSRRKDGTKIAHLYYRCAGTGAARKGCGVMIDLDLADAAALHMLRRHLDTPVIERVLIAGKDWSAEVAHVEFELSRLGMQGLDEDDEDAKRAELRAEKKRLLALPVTVPSWDEIEMPFTYLSMWEKLPQSQRGLWLAEKGFFLWAYKTGVSMERPVGGLAA